MDKWIKIVLFYQFRLHTQFARSISFPCKTAQFVQLQSFDWQVDKLVPFVLPCVRLFKVLFHKRFKFITALSRLFITKIKFFFFSLFFWHLSIFVREYFPISTAKSARRNNFRLLSFRFDYRKILFDLGRKFTYVGCIAARGKICRHTQRNR